MGLSLQITLLQYSTRFWTYRPPQGWVFDDLTDGNETAYERVVSTVSSGTAF